MNALAPTDFYAEIQWLGVVSDREASLRSQALSEARMTFAGIEGESHSGLTRPSCSRVTGQYTRGTEIRNVRQLTILSAEELDQIAKEIGTTNVEPEWLGASMVLSGIPDFSHIPPSSRLQGPDGATLVVDMQNLPCNWPGKEIETDRPGHGRAFKTAAKGRRGVTAWVECEGLLRVGEQMRLHVPTQRVWSHPI